jgi:hypothetical protein
MALTLAGLLTAEQASAVSAPVPTPPFSNGQEIPGNDCSGVLGNPPDCELNGSPLIVKYNFNDDGTPAVNDPIEFGNFSSIDGSEFKISFDAGGTSSGTWTYTPGAGDPGVTGWTAKAGNSFLVFLGTGLTGTFSTPGGKGLSHIAFFDAAPSPIPLPAAAWLLISGVGALGVVARRRRTLA